MARESATALELDSRRIQHLTGTGPQHSRVTIIGLGSGGFPVLQHLAMSGWHRFTLVDPDQLDAVNLVKHPGRRADLGRYKVEIAAEWLTDRNPKCELTVMPRDVMELDDGDALKLAQESDLVVSATDSNGVRHWINSLCVRAATPMTLGLVHRGGTGGTVMAYRPGESGCYACLEKVAEGLDGLPTDSDYPRTSEEDEMVYGRSIRDYAAAGLSADIALIAAIHAQVTIAELLVLEDARGAALPPLGASWIAMQLRTAGTWDWNPAIIDLPKIDNCVYCGIDQA
jgi:molybdopterin/thiamine biosynthesis adenylyltransferase